MVEISDIPDGDNNGGAPNKKPQEQPGEVKPATSLESLPVDLIEHIVARVPICNHPLISVTSKHFRRIVASPHLRIARSQLAISEHVLYALVGFPPLPPSWYILYRSNNASLRLRRVNTLPPTPYGPAVVAVGHEIYVIGGSDGTRYLPNVTLVDCRTRTCRSLPSMGVARFRAAAGVVNGMIYVMGGCEDRSKDWVEVFDLGRQTWSGMGKELSNVSREFMTCSVVKDKIYALGRGGLHVCEPIEDGELGIWLHRYGSDQLTGLWQPSSCVVDDLLYTIDPVCWPGYPIIVFDPEEGVWKPVRGVYGLPPCLYWYAYESKMAHVGGKLVILVGGQSQFWNYYGEKYIWCVEIALERRRGGEIWGRVESADVVFTTTELTPVIELCRTVIV